MRLYRLLRQQPCNWKRHKSSSSSAAAVVSAEWLDDVDVRSYKNWINGAFVPSNAETSLGVKNPASNETIARVPESDPSEVQQAIDAASEAFPSWKQVPVQQRQRIMLRYQALIRQHTEDLAYWITLENGKTLADARGDIFRGLEVVETACNVADKLMGETLGGISAEMDCTSYRQPLGVCAGIGTSIKTHERVVSHSLLLPCCQMSHTYVFACLLAKTSPIQFPRHDTVVDVPVGLHGGQYVCVEA